MKTFAKSFIGAVLGTFLVLLVAWTILQTKEDNNQISLNRQIESEKIDSSIPAIAAGYFVPQDVDFTMAAEKSVNAVVHIKTEINIRSSSYENFFGPFRDYFGNPYNNNTFVAYGSGVIISPDGYIVTNHHVVENAEKISVTFNNRAEMTAKVVGMDPSTDLALIKVDADDLTYLYYGNSDLLKVGEWVLAVGNPFNLTSTVTAGIVSAKARNINILGTQSSIESFIQTDAVVNRGNSGGALVNTRGELVGINAAIASHTGVYEGYSFAIPVNIVKKIVNDLMIYGQVQRGYIGIQISNIDAEIADELGLEQVAGVYVAGVVENGGAADAGIQQGDVILSINDVSTNSLSELMGTVAQHSPGESVKLKVSRSNKMYQFDVVLKNQDGSTEIIKSEDSFYNDLLGADIQKAGKSELERLGITNGMKITKVEDGILKRGGIKQGFIITEINGKQVNSKNSLDNALISNKQNSIQLKGLYPNGVRVAYEFML
jgi:Do/DeqQ family serine protease